MLQGLVKDTMALVSNKFSTIGFVLLYLPIEEFILCAWVDFLMGQCEAKCAQTTSFCINVLPTRNSMPS